MALYFVTTNGQSEIIDYIYYLTKEIPWLLAGSELYRPSSCRLSAKLAANFVDTWCCVVSATNYYGR
jgi:hypothetical protein